MSKSISIFEFCTFQYQYQLILKSVSESKSIFGASHNSKLISISIYIDIESSAKFNINIFPNPYSISIPISIYIDIELLFELNINIVSNQDSISIPISISIYIDNIT